MSGDLILYFSRAGENYYEGDLKVVEKGNIVDNKVQISQLTKGVYVIAVDNGGKVSQVKFIKK